MIYLKIPIVSVFCEGYGNISCPRGVIDMLSAKLLSLCLALIEDESDKQKFETMFYKYEKLMYHCARKRLNNQQDIEDAVSITFLKAAKNIKIFDEAVSDRTKYILINIVDKTAINIYKQKAKRDDFFVPLQDWDHVEEESHTDLELTVAAAIEKLPEEQRRIITLRYSEGYTNREIAALLDYTVTKVDKMISRARKDLEKMLDGAQYED